MAADLDEPGRAQPVAGAGERVGAEIAADVDHRDPGGRDAGTGSQHEVSISVTVGVHALDVEDASGGGATARQPGRAARRRKPCLRGASLAGPSLHRCGGTLPAARHDGGNREQSAQRADVTTSLPAGSLGLPPAGVKRSS